jgi:RNA polymerase sigma-70 factor (ECF subfamily)
VRLTYKDGLTASQIAQQLEISVSTVRSQAERAIQLLRVAIADKYPVFAGLTITVLLREVLAQGLT